MPNWKTHLEVAKRINKVVKYNDLDLEKFMFGNVLPDINNGYLIKSVSKILEHDYTHYKDIKNKSNYEYFVVKYKDEIKNNPILMGYLTHLITDYIFDRDFESKIKDNGQFNNYSKEELRILKQSEFGYYNNLYKKDILKIKYIDEIILETKIIDRVSIESEDMFNLVIFFKKDILKDYNAKIYDDISFDELVEKANINIINYIKEYIW